VLTLILKLVFVKSPLAFVFSPLTQSGVAPRAPCSRAALQCPCFSAALRGSRRGQGLIIIFIFLLLNLLGLFLL